VIIFCYDFVAQLLLVGYILVPKTVPIGLHQPSSFGGSYVPAPGGSSVARVICCHFFSTNVVLYRMLWR